MTFSFYEDQKIAVSPPCHLAVSTLISHRKARIETLTAFTLKKYSLIFCAPTVDKNTILKNAHSKRRGEERDGRE